MKRIIFTTVALLGAAAAWLTPTALDSSATTSHDGAAIVQPGPARATILTCPPNTVCDDTSWGG
ncbi:hypothetical protein ACFZDG_22920 [Kitasatospora xanthocidica]|uniref:hypothetical protein n=1 Tax=Kitasatospora xanthocidica TaxID=83382 RepID=UPI0036F075D3